MIRVVLALVALSIAVPSRTLAQTVVYQAHFTTKDAYFTGSSCLNYGSTSLLGVGGVYSPNVNGILFDRSGACVNSSSQIEFSVTLPALVSLPLNPRIQFEGSWLLENGATTSSIERSRLYTYLNGPGTNCNSNYYADTYYVLQPNVMNGATLTVNNGCTVVGTGPKSLRIVIWRPPDLERNQGKAYFLSGTLTIVAP